jgi:ATP-dependent Lon protease
MAFSSPKNFSIPSHLAPSLPVLPIRQGFLLPGAGSPFTIAREASLAALDAAKDGWLIVAIQREPTADPGVSDLLPMAVLARILQPLGNRNKMRAVAIQGVARVTLRSFVRIEPYFEAGWSLIKTPWPDSPEAEGVRRALEKAVEEVAQLMGAEAQVKQMTAEVDDPSLLVDMLASVIESEVEWKHDILMTTDPLARAEKVLKQLAQVKEVIAAQHAVENRVRTEAKGHEREAILRRQLKAIQEELGDGDGDEGLKRLKDRLAAKPLPEEAKNAVDRELKRLERMQGQSLERNVAVDWLEWIADLPWGQYGSTEIDLNKLESVLDESHYGLEDVKKQVVEHLAVRKLAGHGRADVLLLVGPPGVGKTSVAQAIADATGRKLVRVALGGVRDESELRGHRRTYVGSRPGRLIEGLRRSETADPVVLLDEVDKMGRGWQGDPASALLEVLDPEQNHAFTDHYLEVPFDLSKVLFIATANDLSQVPAPLRDRMEILEIEGYTSDEKLTIAKAHVLKKLANNAGVDLTDVQISDDVLEEAIEGWTREAGVRQLQRVLGKIFRAAAVKKAKHQLEGPIAVTRENLGDFLGKRRFFQEVHELLERPGLAMGLAWTPMGGDVLFVEASKMPGTGQLVLTGQLGEVMKESAQAALTFVRSNAARLGADPEVLKHSDIHVHVPAGATPKDGPSAGVTMFTAIASLLTDRPVRSDVAMTGEMTLRGRVLPVGGIKAKVLAAHARGIRTVILPARNEVDLADLPEKVRKEMRFVPVSQMTEVLAEALEPRAGLPTLGLATPGSTTTPAA